MAPLAHNQKAISQKFNKLIHKLKNTFVTYFHANTPTNIKLYQDKEEKDKLKRVPG